jgi:hypothetical protein
MHTRRPLICNLSILHLSDLYPLCLQWLNAKQYHYMVIHFNYCSFMLHDPQGNADIVPTSHLQSYLTSYWLRVSRPVSLDQFPVPWRTWENFLHQLISHHMAGYPQDCTAG